jgi:hypothetical protein
METLYGLSIRQPWLDMFVRGVKTMDIRTWQVKRRGVVALHAPRRIDFSAAYFYGYERPWELPRAKIIAVADIEEVIALDSYSWDMFLQQHRQPLPMADGAYGVTLANVRVLKVPVACRGRQMLFPIAENIAHRVRNYVKL